jgi:hypothetical protein
MKKALFLVACLAALLWVACEEEIPDYVGVWVDSTTLSIGPVPVTFDLSADEGTITIDKPGTTEDIVFTANLAQDGSTLTATITALSVGGTAVPDGLIDATLVGLGVTGGRTQSFTYDVTGDTLTITGDLISDLTLNYPGGQKDTLTAIRT